MKSKHFPKNNTGTQVNFISGTGGKRDRFTAFFLVSSIALDYYEEMTSQEDDFFVGCIG